MASLTHITPQNQTLMRWASYASVAVAGILLAGKIVAWWISDSLAMLSSLTDSFFDVIASVINMIALRYALKPADDDHRFGHTAIEDIAGLAQCAFINAAMLLIMLQSAERLVNPRPLAQETVGMAVCFLAIGFTTALVLFQSFVARRTGSLIVTADRLHYAGDIAFNLGVLLALALSAGFGYTQADPAIAIVIALAVIWHTKAIGIRAFNNLMDREMPDAEKAHIMASIESFPQIRGVHKLKTRTSGTKPFIQMHVELEPDLSFRHAHDVTDQLEKKLQAAYPGAEIIIHPDLYTPPSP